MSTSNSNQVLEISHFANKPNLRMLHMRTSVDGGIILACFQVDGATLVMEEKKAEAAFNYFSGILGTTHDREGRLDFEALGIQ
jgi:hypothetical protein